MSKEDSSPSRRHITSDAKLGLERLIVGRECNAFDRLPSERKALAFAELIGLGFVKGNIKEVPGRAYPDVIVQHVTSSGRKAYRRKEHSGSTNGLFSASKIALFAILVLVVVLVVLSLNH